MHNTYVNHHTHVKEEFCCSNQKVRVWVVTPCLLRVKIIYHKYCAKSHVEIRDRPEVILLHSTGLMHRKKSVEWVLEMKFRRVLKLVMNWKVIVPKTTTKLHIMNENTLIMIVKYFHSRNYCIFYLEYDPSSSTWLMDISVSHFNSTA